MESKFVRHEGDIVIDTKKVDIEAFNPEQLPSYITKEQTPDYYLYILSNCEIIKSIKYPGIWEILDKENCQCFYRGKIHNHDFGINLLKNLWVIE